MMLVVIAYDVNTGTNAGKRRLRRVAKVCEDYGQRVQKSVFECWIDPADWVKLRARLAVEIQPQRDSLRFYFLGEHWKGRIEQIGACESHPADEPLIL